MTITNAFDATEIDVKPLDSSRLQRAKAAYVTRRLNLAKRACYLLSGDIKPNAGDIVLARVIEICQHKRLELVDGRRSILFPDDEVMVCYGNRYAPDQFAAEVPPGLGECSLVAAGGIAAQVLTQHKNISSATRLSPIGLMAEIPDRPLNVMDAALLPTEWPTSRPPTLAVFGTAMNSGKTVSAAYLVKGLKRAGLAVGAAKITGTGAGPDTWLMRDAGADVVLDFTDAGYCSTFRVSTSRVENVATTLVHRLAGASVDAIVLEIADGLHQTETRALLKSERFNSLVDGVLFAARDASGAKAGVDIIRNLGHNLCAVTGALGASPLAIQETRDETGAFVADITELACAEVAEQLLAAACRAPTVARAM